MKTHRTNPWTILITIVITAIITAGAVMMLKNLQMPPEGMGPPVETIEIPGETIELPDAELENWHTYTSEKGFLFQYPPGHTVSESINVENPDTISVFIAAVDEAGNLLERPPVLQMNISPNSISFSLWEGIPWEGFPKIIETFKWE